MRRRTSALERSRKVKPVQERVCELVFRPAAHVVVRALLPLRVPPPAVVLASGAAGVAGAVELARGHLLAAALLVQLKTVLDNADGQLARLSGRVTPFGRYLDSECDLLVNAALFAGLASYTGRPFAALAGFVALTLVLSVNFNVERLYRAERAPARAGAAEPASPLARVYDALYGWQDRLVERVAEGRLRGASRAQRLAYHDRATVGVLAQLGMSSQLLAFGAFVALHHPLWAVWFALAQVGFVALLALRRESLLRRPALVTADREAAA
ncbi:MAG: CDP-alcohol phosphatidyltransferase family protein [Gaiellaceae bacterium]